MFDLSSSQPPGPARMMGRERVSWLTDSSQITFQLEYRPEIILIMILIINHKPATPPPAQP